MLVLMFACAMPGAGGEPPAPGADLCARPDAVDGEVSGAWTGDGQDLLLSEDFGGWSDGCYGGTIDPPYVATAGAFDWDAEFFIGAGAPEPRPIRAAGCVAGDWMDLSILEEDGTVFWGPWRLERTEHVDIGDCD